VGRAKKPGTRKTVGGGVWVLLSFLTHVLRRRIGREMTLLGRKGKNNHVVVQVCGNSGYKKG